MLLTNATKLRYHISMKQVQHSCESELQEAQLKVTPARIAAIKLFEKHHKPLDAQHIINHLQKDLGVDRVTVFRMLNAFTERGLVRKLEFGEGKSRYELNTGEHHHLICRNCGSIEDIVDCDIASLEKEIMIKKHFLVEKHALEFFGLCETCQQ